ncbi:hypothetical protein ACKLNO_12045 [Neisseriaceae bacterium B1]
MVLQKAFSGSLKPKPFFAPHFCIFFTANPLPSSRKSPNLTPFVSGSLKPY